MLKHLHEGLTFSSFASKNSMATYCMRHFWFENFSKLCYPDQTINSWTIKNPSYRGLSFMSLIGYAFCISICVWLVEEWISKKAFSRPKKAHNLRGKSLGILLVEFPIFTNFDVLHVHGRPTPPVEPKAQICSLGHHNRGDKTRTLARGDGSDNSRHGHIHTKKRTSYPRGDPLK